MGLATARALAQAGRDVVVCEQFELGHVRGSSHGSSRIVRLSYPDERWVRFAQETFPLWRELEAESGRRLLDLHGTLDLGDWEPNRDALAACGAPFEVLDAGQIEQRFGIRADAGESGLFQADGGIVHADEAVAAFADGLEVREHVRVETVDEDGDGVTAGGVRARVAVVTAGAWAPRLVGVDATPTRGDRHRTSTFGRPMPSVIDTTTGARHGYALASPGDSLKAGLHQSGPPDGPGRARRARPQSSPPAPPPGSNGGSPAQGRRRATETCLYTIRGERRVPARADGAGSSSARRAAATASSSLRWSGKRLAALALEVRSSGRGRAPAGMTRSWPLLVPRTSTPRMIAAGIPFVLPDHELGRPRELVRDRDLRRMQLVADAVADAAEVEQRRHPRGTERHVGRSLAERPAERVADDHADVAAQPARGAPPGCRAAEASGSSGRSTSVPSPFAFEASTPADAQMKPWRVSVMISGGRTRTTWALSRQDRLDVARVAVVGELERPLRRLDLVQPHDAALGLRDHLLGDDEHVGVLEAARALGRVGQEQPREVVAFLDLRDALERDRP